MEVAKNINESGQFFSFEFFPPKDKKTWPSFMDKAQRLADLKPLFASVTYGAGGTSHDNSLEICSALKKDMGIDILAHLTCVGASEKSIDDFAASLKWSGSQIFLPSVVTAGPMKRGRVDSIMPRPC